jgi:hypothetical protein
MVFSCSIGDGRHDGRRMHQGLFEGPDRMGDASDA